MSLASDISPKIAILKDRAAMLAKTRSFFSDRDVLEVDCPILSSAASVDAHIDLIIAQTCGQATYLHSSPEYGMKRLLSQGIGDIFQLSHVFRDGEVSKKHSPEFMMVEWYRTNFPFLDMIQETIEFIRLFLGPLPSKIITYREALRNFAAIDYVTMTREELSTYVLDHALSQNTEGMCKDDLLNLVLGVKVEPHLGKDELCVLNYYPSSQAALAQTLTHNDEQIAERFEVYYKGVELANGYHELGNAQEQRQRLLEANDQRMQMNKSSLPIDEDFLLALEKGIPDCCGVAVGFDRLMMLRHHQTEISMVVPIEKLL